MFLCGVYGAIYNAHSVLIVGNNGGSDDPCIVVQWRPLFHNYPNIVGSFQIIWVHYNLNKTCWIEA